MRNYAKESEWDRSKYGRMTIKLDKDLIERFKAKCQQEGITYADWARSRIKQYLGEE